MRAREIHENPSISAYFSNTPQRLHTMNTPFQNPFTSAFTPPFVAPPFAASSFAASPFGTAAPHNASTQPLGPWLAPTTNPQELDRRIQELKTVQFWLEQNTRALAATIQMLEVQKLTLMTLNNMGANMTEIMQSWSNWGQNNLNSKNQGSNNSFDFSSPQENKTENPQPQASFESMMQPWWGTLLQQFQNIAATQSPPTHPAENPAPETSKPQSE